MRKFTKLAERNPDFIQDETIEVNNNVTVDTIVMWLESDTARFLRELDEYILISDSLKEVIHSNEHDFDKLSRKKYLADLKNEKLNRLFAGAATVQQYPLISKDSIVNYTVRFDPFKKQISFWGTHKERTKFISRTVKQLVREEITNWQAIKRVWWAFLLLLVVIVILAVFKR